MYSVLFILEVASFLRKSFVYTTFEEMEIILPYSDSFFLLLRAHTL